MFNYAKEKKTIQTSTKHELVNTAFPPIHQSLYTQLFVKHSMMSNRRPSARVSKTMDKNTLQKELLEEQKQEIYEASFFSIRHEQ